MNSIISIQNFDFNSVTVPIQLFSIQNDFIWFQFSLWWNKIISIQFQSNAFKCKNGQKPVYQFNSNSNASKWGMFYNWIWFLVSHNPFQFNSNSIFQHSFWFQSIQIQCIKMKKQKTKQKKNKKTYQKSFQIQFQFQCMQITPILNWA